MYFSLLGTGLDILIVSSAYIEIFFSKSKFYEMNENIKFPSFRNASSSFLFLKEVYKNECFFSGIFGVYSYSNENYS